MNFLDAEVVDRGGVIWMIGAGFELALDGENAAAVKAHDRNRITLGIRPSDLIFDADAPEETSFELKVVVSEYIGAHSVLMCDCGGQQIVVELKSETPIPLGETLRFRVNPQGFHLFDMESGKAI
jgi:multiple sugar transport system ATP-binding protein